MAEDCSYEGMEAFLGSMAECGNRRVDICSRQPGCTEVGEESGLRRCGLEASSVLEHLTNSEISHIELLGALIEVRSHPT